MTTVYDYSIFHTCRRGVNSLAQVRTASMRISLWSLDRYCSAQCWTNWVKECPKITKQRIHDNMKRNLKIKFKFKHMCVVRQKKSCSPSKSKLPRVFNASVMLVASWMSAKFVKEAKMERNENHLSMESQHNQMSKPLDQ